MASGTTTARDSALRCRGKGWPRQRRRIAYYWQGRDARRGRDVAALPGPAGRLPGAGSPAQRESAPSSGCQDRTLTSGVAGRLACSLSMLLLLDQLPQASQLLARDLFAPQQMRHQTVD